MNLMCNIGMPLVWIAFFVATSQNSRGQVPKEPPKDTLSFLESVSEYKISAEGSDKFELRVQPILLWTNPSRYDQSGAVFIWMHSGRPQAIGSCFNFENAGQPRTIHEFHSLADSSISAMFRDVAFWHPAQPGLQFQLSQNPPQVADTHQRRLAQMRQISREFSAEMVDPKGSVTVLRLLPTPLITYEPKTEQCTDGAIFSFAADGTDPDVLLVIENRTVNRKPGWYHALARFHYNELNVSKGGQNIWKAESKQEMSRNYRTSNLFRNETYITFRIR